ncbi:MAG: hypothetical protein HYX76_10180 [Acidobacteria bacterium]|nr:hypothetical protein [Acidobacteriota bacterium]
MATCPYCHSHLTATHVCARRASRFFKWISILLASATIGGVIGAALFSTIGNADLGLIGLLTGAIAAFVILRSMQRPWLF